MSRLVVFSDHWISAKLSYTLKYINNGIMHVSNAEGINTVSVWALEILFL